MAIDTIKFKRGVKSKLNNLSYGEPAYISDENELYIGTENGVEKITRNKEVAELSSQLEHNIQTLNDALKDISINIKDFGAIGDGVYHKLSEFYSTLEEAQKVYPTAQTLDDSIDLVAIEKAQNSTEHRYIKVFSPAGTYMFNRTLVQREGTFFIGNGIFSTIYKLTPLANCTLFSSPTEGNHHCSLEGIGFNGNKSNQTKEVELVKLDKLFIGSKLGDIAINNFYGCGLSMGRCDIYFKEAWIWDGYTRSGRYAVEINRDLTSGQVGHYNFEHIYVELYFNNLPMGEAKESDRAVGMLINRVVSFYCKDLHAEYIKGVIDVKDSFAINIDNPSTYSMGDGSESSSFITCLNNNITMLRLGAGFGSGFKYWVKKSDGVSAYWLEDELCNSNVHGVYQVINPTNWSNQQRNILNRLSIYQDTEFINGNIKLKTSKDSAHHFIKISNNKCYFGSNFNETEDINFISYSSTGNAGKSVTIHEPIYLPNRTVKNNIGNNALYTLKNIPTTSINNVHQSFCTIRTGSNTPTIIPDFIGQLYIDTSNKNAYIAVASSSLSDWKQITN